MTGIRTGIDLLEINRFQRAIQQYGDRFLNRIYTSRELTEAGSNITSLAERFAAKEAVSKAFGTGIGDVSWREIEIYFGDSPSPSLYLWGRAREIAVKQGMSEWALSLSHTSDYALAVVITSEKNS